VSVNASIGGQGSTAAIGVTVQNVGGQNVSSNVDVTLSDATTGLTIGTQTISGGLAAGGSTMRTFNWNTAGASLGSHTLVATHNYVDVNSANDQASVPVTVSPPSMDIAVTALNAPASVGKGSTATITVTVQNVACRTSRAASMSSSRTPRRGDHRSTVSDESRGGRDRISLV
jgi:hypothetical protein